MKRIIKITSLLMISAVLLTACAKEDIFSQAYHKHPILSKYKVTDILQVNDSDGAPGEFKPLDFTPGDIIWLTRDEQNNPRILINNKKQNKELLSLVENEEGTFVLVNRFSASASMAGGIVYYKLEKN